MMTVNEVSKITGVSVRALHHYDAIGLLKPAFVTDSGYRMYNTENLERLEQIMIFRELEFSLADIKVILDNPDFDRKKALNEQIKLLTLKKSRIENIISFAKQIEKTGVYKMNFKVFDKKTIEKYSKEAKEQWGNTDAYLEYSKKSENYSDEKVNSLAAEMMRIFAEFGDMLDRSPEEECVQIKVKKLQDFITDNYYTCPKEILSGLGQMYAAGGEMTDNINAAGGKGTAEFTAKAIAVYCK